ncbi:MAG: hypothetical protein QXG97_03070 [Nitrososphaerota archaeon]
METAQAARTIGRRIGTKSQGFGKPLRLNWLNRYSAPALPNSSLAAISAAIVGEAPPTAIKTEASSVRNIPYEARTQGVYAQPPIKRTNPK